MLAGVFGGLAAVTIMTVIGDVFPAEKRGRAAGAVMSSFAVASIMGLPIGLLIADGHGRGAHHSSYCRLERHCVACGIDSPTSRSRPSQASARHPWIEFLNVIHEPRHLWAFGFSFFMILGTFTVASFSGPYLSHEWLGRGQAGHHLSDRGILTLVGMNAIGRLSDRYNRLRLVRVLMLLTIVTGLTITNLPPVSLWLATLVLAAFMVVSAGR